MANTDDDDPMINFSVRLPSSYIAAADKIQDQLGHMADRSKVIRSSLALGLAKLLRNPQAALKTPAPLNYTAGRGGKKK